MLRLRAAGCVFAEDEEAAIRTRFGSDPTGYAAAVDERCAGALLEHVLGEAEFAGVRVRVVAPVFAPRRRAESLVEVAGSLGGGAASLVALDLGCGSGAIAAALADRHPGWDVHASDVDPDALECARLNSEQFGFTVHAGDWFEALPRQLSGRLDLVVAHLPYVPTADLGLLPRDFRDAERLGAVDGGEDGLEPWRAVTAQCLPWLTRDGSLLTQVTHAQAAAATDVALRAGLDVSAVDSEEAVVLIATPRG